MNAVQIEAESKMQVPGDADKRALTTEQRQVLSDPKIQEQYRQAYSLQQARRSCPGCGETGLSF
jgi:hypothetical protein